MFLEFEGIRESRNLTTLRNSIQGQGNAGIDSHFCIPSHKVTRLQDFRVTEFDMIKKLRTLSFHIDFYFYRVHRFAVSSNPEKMLFILCDLFPPIMPNSSCHSYFRKDIASNDTSIMHECKMLWENPGLGMGLKRKEAGIWQARFTLKHHTWLVIFNDFFFLNQTR